MSTTEKLPRPPQVTLVGWLIVVGSVFVVVSAYEAITGVRSLDTRELIQEYLDGPGGSLGWSVEQGVRALQVSAMVTAVCGAAAAVLGWFALRRDRGARIGLSVLALPLFLSGIVTGGFVSSMVAAAAVLLWMQPARDWFNGKPMAVRSQERTSMFRGSGSSGSSGSGTPDAHDSAPHVSGPPAQVPPGQVGEAGRPVQGFGDQPTWGRPTAPGPEAAGQAQQGPYGVPPGAPYGAPPASQHGAPQDAPQGYLHDPQQPAPHPYAGQPYPGPSGRRPWTLITAVVLTLVFAGFSLVSSLVSLAVAIAAPDVLFDEFLRQQPDLLEQGVTRETINATMLFSASVMSLFSLCAVIAALLVLARKAGGLPILLLIAGFSAAFCLIGTVMVPVLLLPGIASAAVVALLLRPESKAWLNGH